MAEKKRVIPSASDVIPSVSEAAAKRQRGIFSTVIVASDVITQGPSSLPLLGMTPPSAFRHLPSALVRT
jgi:hypothetical protein